MDENPWDFWARTNVLTEAQQNFSSSNERVAWRLFQDMISDRYQQQYAAFKKQQADTPWWQRYVSQSVITWTYLDGLEHPLDVPRLARETEQ